MDIKRVKRRLRAVLVVWALSIFPIGFCAALAPRWPSWVELPWSDISDFVVTPDGRMYVYNGFFEQMMVYGAAGDFQISWPGPGYRPSSGGDCLAVAEDGRIFLLSYNTVFALSSQGEELFRVSGDRAGSRVWRLTENGGVEIVHNPRPDTRSPDRPVRNGEILLGEECSGTHGPWPHSRYDRPDGGAVHRHLGPRLEICFPDGRTRTVMTPWYLLWAQLPFPAVPWIVLLIWERSERKQKRSESSAAGRDSTF